MAKKSKVVVPQVRNISDVKTTPKTPTLFHMTAAQWAKATKGAVEARSLPKGRSFIEFKPIPGEGGIITAECGAPAPEDQCRVREVIDVDRPPGREPWPGPGPGPETRGGERVMRGSGPALRWVCECRSPGGHGGAGFHPVPGKCELVLNLERPLFRCESNGCTRQCRLVWVRDGNRFLLSCQCQ